MIPRYTSTEHVLPEDDLLCELVGDAVLPEPRAIRPYVEDSSLDVEGCINGVWIAEGGNGHSILEAARTARQLQAHGFRWRVVDYWTREPVELPVELTGGS